MADRRHEYVTGHCEHCGKITYLSRRAARQTAKLHQPHKAVYRCPHYDQFWHVGGLAEPVRRGEVSREGFYINGQRMA